MKIVHFLPFFDPNSKGGTETFIQSLAREQKAHGHDVHVVCPNVEEKVRRTNVGGLEYISFPYPYRTQTRKFLAGLHAHPTCAKFEAIIRDLDPDIFHLHGLYPPFLPYIERIHGASRAALMLTVHLPNIVCSRQTLIDNRGEACDGRASFNRCAKCVSEGRSSRRAADALLRPLSFRFSRWGYTYRLLEFFPAHARVAARIRTLDFIRSNIFVDALTPHIRDVFLRNGFAGDRVECFNNPNFDSCSFEPFMATRKASEPLSILMVGRVSVDKGVGLLLDVIAHLQDLKNEFSVKLVGKCEDLELQRKVRAFVSLGYDIDLLGELDLGRIKKLYEDADYLLSASLPGIEMLPMVIQEAFESEIAVIASYTPATQSLVHHGINGYLFKAGDREELSQILRKVITSAELLRFRYQPIIQTQEGRTQYYSQRYAALLANSPKASEMAAESAM